MKSASCPSVTRTRALSQRNGGAVILSQLVSAQWGGRRWARSGGGSAQKVVPGPNGRGGECVPLLGRRVLGVFHNDNTYMTPVGDPPPPLQPRQHIRDTHAETYTGRFTRQSGAELKAVLPVGSCLSILQIGNVTRRVDQTQLVRRDALWERDPGVCNSNESGFLFNDTVVVKWEVIS